MNELAQIRSELDSIDTELVRLFERRMVCSRKVAAYKIANGMPVLDASREEQVLESRAAALDDSYWSEDVKELFRHIMKMSRREQEVLLKEAGR